MEYKLVKSSNDDIERLIEYKKRNIYEYAPELSEEEHLKIKNYVESHIPKDIDDYYNIVVDGKVVGCLFVVNKDDGKLLDEIYLEEDYRGLGIGTDIIKNVLKENDIVYLWAYKDNVRAVSLYKRLGFVVIEDSDFRYHMKYSKNN